MSSTTQDSPNEILKSQMRKIESVSIRVRASGQLAAAIFAQPNSLQSALLQYKDRAKTKATTVHVQDLIDQVHLLQEFPNLVMAPESQFQGNSEMPQKVSQRGLSTLRTQ
jgi:hypothetical protein